MKQCLAVLALLLNCSIAFADLIPVEHFAKHSKYEDVVISPTGEYLAITMRNDESKYMVAILRTKDMSITGVIPPAGKQEIFNPIWVTDERLVVQLAERWGDLDTPRPNGELVAINANGKKKKMLTQHQRSYVSTTEKNYRPKNKLQGHSEIIHILPKDKKHVLIEYYPFGVAYKEKKSSAYKLNIFNGKVKRVAVAPSVWSNFVTDGYGEITHAAGFDTSNNNLLIHKLHNGDWQLTETIENLGTGSEPIAAIADSHELIIKQTQTTGPAKIYKLNVDTKERSLLYKHKSVDPGHIVRDRITNNPIAIHFDPDYPDLHLIDNQHPIGNWYPALYQAFGGKRVVITSATDDYKTLALHVSADNDPGQFHLFDTEKKKLRFIFQAKPWMNTDQLNTTEPFSFKTSDGIKLHGYITKPKSSDGNIPLVVHPHGGPHGPRDYWQYNNDVQLLASRGYAVLQVNFRGSGGYGNQFEASGYRHWGDLIQQDIIEATEWAISNQGIDSDRICIYGASFGGYSALMAPTIKPDLFQCAIGYVGVYDLNLMWDDGDIQKMNYGVNYLNQAIGKDKPELDKFSPLNNIDKLKAPVFLIHGAEDERVPVSHFYALQKALKKSNHPTESMLAAGEGHGFYQVENRQEMYERLLNFLDKHIGNKKVAQK